MTTYSSYPSYDSIMLIDGNDERGIDVGLMTRSGTRIESMISHVDDVLDGRRVFSRDCPEYTVRTQDGAKLIVMVNHLKSKGYGSTTENDSRRRAQAQRIRQIYDQRRAAGDELDDNFVSDGRPGTHGNGAKGAKLDYLLLSPALAGRLGRAGVERRGVWGGKNGDIFPHYPEITAPVHAASDHAALWADIDV